MTSQSLQNRISPQNIGQSAALIQHNKNLNDITDGVSTDRLSKNTPAHAQKLELKLGKTEKSGLLLIEDVRLVRESMASLLRSRCPELEIHTCAYWQDDIDSGYFKTGHFDELQKNPSLILLDLHHNSVYTFTDGDQAKCLEARFHDTPILAISERYETDEAVMAIDKGLAGFFPMRCSAELLVAAIRLVMAGGRFIPPEILSVNALPALSRKNVHS